MEDALAIVGSLAFLYFIGFGIVLLIGWLLRKITPRAGWLTLKRTAVLAPIASAIVGGMLSTSLDRSSSAPNSGYSVDSALAKLPNAIASSIRIRLPSILSRWLHD